MSLGERLSLPRLRQQGVLAAVDVHFARVVTRLGDTNDPLVQLGAAMASRAPRFGHVCLELSRADDDVRLEPVEGRAPVKIPWPDPERWRATLAASSVVGDGAGAPTPLVLQGDRLYLERYWRYQERLVDQLAARCSDVVPVQDAAALREGLVRLFPVTEQEPDLQRLAALMAALRRFCVISGGPGTGKTHTLVRVLALLVEQAQAVGAEAPRIVMMAPTGKAAARMKEAVRSAKADQQQFPVRQATLDLIPESASTIHRGLGWQPRTPHRFRHDGAAPLPADVVVVDEASMVPLILMAKLVDAVSPRARLILLGDRDQLASVEAGAVLGDICGGGAAETHFSAAFSRQVEDLFGPLPPAMVAEGPVPPVRDCTIHLTRSHRFGMASGIRAASMAVIAGQATSALDLLRGKHQQTPHPDLDLLEVQVVQDLEAQLKKVVLPAYEQLVTQRDPGAALQTLRAFKVLCAHRRGLFGADALNDRIRAWLVTAGLVPDNQQWYPGRPVLVCANDYQLNLFNGDDGVVLPSAEGDGRLRAFFPEPGGEGLRSCSLARLPAHESVFAMTIHKSQGSEFGRVVVVLPDRVSPVLTRELIYTAITRAREHVSVVGSEEVFRAGVEQLVSRASGMRERLWEA
jgi:exodeoxyribonuclease V alpha subunit